MPLGKFYCDYCEKQFQDTPSARKRHLEGLQHQRAKALWYASVNSGAPDAASPGAAGAFPPRGVCHHFVRTGYCQFGDACRYFHPKKDVRSEHPAIPGATAAGVINAPSSTGAQFVRNPVLGNMVSDHSGISSGNLPPSLQPPPEGGYPPLPFVDWV